MSKSTAAFKREGGAVEGWTGALGLAMKGAQTFVLIAAPSFLSRKIIWATPLAKNLWNTMPQMVSMEQLDNKEVMEQYGQAMGEWLGTNVFEVLIVLSFLAFGYLVITPTVVGATMIATAQLKVSGQQPDPVRCLRKSFTRYPTLILSMYLTGFGYWICCLLIGFVVGVVFAVLDIDPQILPGVLPVLALAFVAYAETALKFVGPAIYIESQTAIGATKRSFKLTRGHFWSIFWTIFRFNVLVITFSLPIGDGILKGLVVSQLTTIFLTNLYINLRGEKEGLDEEALKQELANDSAFPLPQQQEKKEDNIGAQHVNKAREAFLNSMEADVDVNKLNPSQDYPAENSNDIRTSSTDTGDSIGTKNDNNKYGSSGGEVSCGLVVMIGLIGIIMVAPFAGVLWYTVSKAGAANGGATGPMVGGEL